MLIIKIHLPKAKTTRFLKSARYWANINNSEVGLPHSFKQKLLQSTGYFRNNETNNTNKLSAVKLRTSSFWLKLVKKNRKQQEFTAQIYVTTSR